MQILTKIEITSVVGCGKCVCQPGNIFSGEYNFPELKDCKKRCCEDFPPRKKYSWEDTTYDC